MSDQFEGAKVVRVTAMIEFQAYAMTDVAEFRAGMSVGGRVAEEIANAIGYHAPHGTDLESGDALIAMTSEPDFAVDVRSIAVIVVDRPVNMEHVIDRAQSVTASL